MQILHIITSLGLGGAEGVLYRIVINDKKNEHVIISLTGKGYYSELYKSLGIKTYCLEFNKNIIFFKNIVGLLRLIKQISPDIIQTWMYHANLISLFVPIVFRKKNIFWNLRATSEISFVNLKSSILAVVLSILSYFIPYKIICCSKSVKLNHKKLGFNSKKLVIINNGSSVFLERNDLIIISL
jgi:hypothetical protein